jgi:hypothetical protein
LIAAAACGTLRCVRGLSLAVAVVACSPTYPGVPVEERETCGTGDGTLGAFCCAAEECESGECRDAVCTTACTRNEDCGACDASGCPNLCMVTRSGGFCLRDCAEHPELCEGDTECRLVSEMPEIDLEHNTNFENVDAERVACFRFEDE